MSVEYVTPGSLTNSRPLLGDGFKWQNKMAKWQNMKWQAVLLNIRHLANKKNSPLAIKLPPGQINLQKKYRQCIGYIIFFF